MATLGEYKSKQDTVALSKRGTTTRQLGAKVIPTITPIPKSQGFVEKVSDVASQTRNLVGSGIKNTASYIKNTAVDIGKAAYGTGRTFVDYQTQPFQSKVYSEMSKRLEAKEREIVQQYKSGAMSKQDYAQSLKDLSKAYSEIGKKTKEITAGPTPQQRAQDIAETAVNALALGNFQLTKLGAKQAVQAGRREAVEALVDQTTTGFERALFKNPALKQLVIRNLEQGGKRELQKLAGESTEKFLLREGRNIASDLLIKRPIFYQSNIGEAKNVYKEVLEGDYPAALKSSAWLASQMLEGGPIGAFFKTGSWAKRGLKKLSYGEQSFIDELSKRIGNGNPAQISRFLTGLKTKAPNEYKEVERVFRILQEGNLQSADNDVQRAVDNLVTHYQQNNIPLESLTPSQIYKDMSNWVKADDLWEDTVKKGLIPGISKADARKYTPVRWDAETRNGIANAFKGTAGGPEEKMAILDELANQPGAGWSNNEVLMNRLREAVANNITGNDIARDIQSIDAAVVSANLPKRVAKRFADLGYTIALPKGGRVTPHLDITDTRKLVSGAIAGNADIFDPSNAPQPVFSTIARGLEVAGLSPRSANNVAYQKLGQNVAASLDDVNLKRSLGFVGEGDHATGGQAILSRLQEYVDAKKPSKIGNALTLNQNTAAAITDIRQLTPQEIAEALSTPGSKMLLKDARQVSKAIMQGYLDVPMEFRGLGDKVVDTLYRYNPLQKYYSRVQSALRYNYNPFFRLQENVETNLLAGAGGGNRFTNALDHNLVWNKSRQQLDETAKFLDESGVFASSLSGEAAQDQILGRITANVTQGQKRDLAGLALDIAKSKGTTLDDLIRNSPDELTDALRIVVQYPKKGILSSALARTMNVAFFPIRYNTKVTLVAAKALAQQPPSVQKAFIHSMFEMKDWLKSDEGIAWQAANADAIQIFKWITPINSIQATMNLLSHKPDSIAELGALGGLPLGVITQLLDSQGIIDINRPYVNPKTGDVLPDYIPQTTQARAAVALTDLLGSTFTYPGRILGLPGKEATLKKIVANFIDTNGKDFEKNIDTENLTPLQRRWIEVLKGDTSKEAIDSLYNAPAPGQYNGYTLPPLELPFNQPPVVERRTGLPKKTKGKKAKKIALPMPPQ